MVENTENTSAAYYFLLLEFSDSQNLQVLYFLLFLTLYFVTITGNLLIITVIAFERHLHTPMYFFMMNLAIMDLGSISVTIPKSMFNAFFNIRMISFSECVAQVFFLTFFIGADFALLTVMAHDRYVAICNPLHYETIMTKEACVQMAAYAWISGLGYGVLHTSCTFAKSFCSNVVDQYFCEIPHLLKLSCSDLYLAEVGAVVFSAIVVFIFFIFIVISYVQILATVLKMPSVDGRKKALSTCLPHLFVLSMLVLTGLFTNLRPSSASSLSLDLIFSLTYTTIPPMMNPLIYSMRNKEIKYALWRMLCFKSISKNQMH